MPGRYPPWSRMPYLQEMSEEAGIDFDSLIEAFRRDDSLEEMAKSFGVRRDTIISLKEHFEHYGISTVMGGD